MARGKCCYFFIPTGREKRTEFAKKEERAAKVKDGWVWLERLPKILPLASLAAFVIGAIIVYSYLYAIDSVSLFAQVMSSPSSLVSILFILLILLIFIFAFVGNLGLACFLWRNRVQWRPCNPPCLQQKSRFEPLFRADPSWPTIKAIGRLNDLSWRLGISIRMTWATALRKDLTSSCRSNG